VRLELGDRVVLVTLSQRNLAALLHKLTIDGSARMLFSGDVYRDGLAVEEPVLIVRCETDHEHYSGRPEPAGEMLPDSEAYIARIADEGGPVEAALMATLGPAGAMVGLSKTHYHHTLHPDHFVIFNANVCTAALGKVWFGDFDVTVSEPQLLELARRLGEPCYLLYEGDARFANEQRPLLDRAVLTVWPDGDTAWDAQTYERDADGSLRQRQAER
jgi:hypothetical protein